MPTGKQSPALERAVTLMQLPMGQLSPRVLECMKILSSKYGFCGEVCLTALCHYVQIDEGLKCTEIDYMLSDRSMYDELPPKREPVSISDRINTIDN